MPKIDVNKLDDEKKLKIIKKAIEKHGLSYVSRQLEINRSTLNRYINGKIQNVHNQLIQPIHFQCAKTMQYRQSCDHQPKKNLLPYIDL
jgi:hypothetical protein